MCSVLVQVPPTKLMVVSVNITVQAILGTAIRAPGLLVVNDIEEDLWV